jgi:hypothetical protein
MTASLRLEIRLTIPLLVVRSEDALQLVVNILRDETIPS